jgi:hypothetical protein
MDVRDVILKVLTSPCNAAEFPELAGDAGQLHRWFKHLVVNDLAMVYDDVKNPAVHPMAGGYTDNRGHIWVREGMPYAQTRHVWIHELAHAYGNVCGAYRALHEVLPEPLVMPLCELHAELSAWLVQADVWGANPEPWSAAQLRAYANLDPEFLVDAARELAPLVEETARMLGGLLRTSELEGAIEC